MKKYLLSFVMTISSMVVFGFHIVGGEIEFQTLDVGLYRISLIQYRDEVQQENTFYEPSIIVNIFSNKDHSRVGIYELSRASISEVPYTNQECAIDELETSKVIYTADFKLNPEDFADEEGYYIVYERCCRNQVIKNIDNPGDTGMEYILEIPPLWRDGRPFINSSPTLLRPLSDYACVGQLYYTEFTGTDPDGDSLSYQLVTPLNSSALAAVPPITPKPTIPVRWADGYGINNVVPGSRPLGISNEGLLTVNPSETGVYVFSVLVREWRDGVVIGAVQRDFQMLVVDGCTPPDPPEVAVIITDRPDFNPDLDILSFELADEKCFEFVVTNITPGETISLRAKGVNFTGYLDDVFAINQQPVGSGQDSLLVEVCMPGCPPVRNGPFIVDLIAADDACPVPQLDTARLKIEIEAPPNEFPVINQFLVDSYKIKERDSLKLPITSTDADNDSIEFNLVVKGLPNPERYGFELVTLSQESGESQGQLIWRTDCKEFDFSDVQVFEVGVYAEDLDLCEVESPTVVWYTMEVLLPDNTSPIIRADVQDSVAILLGEELSFDVRATDADMDELNLSLRVRGSEPETKGMQFEEVNGFGAVESQFEWQALCEVLDIDEGTTYELQFYSEDKDYCQVTNKDNETIKVHVAIPENTKPEFESVMADTVININELFELDITAFDFDEDDSVSLAFFNPARLPRSEVIEFASAKGYGEVTSTFRWVPECDLLDLGETSAFFEIPFIAFDDNCPAPSQETMSLLIEVRETREEFNQFKPPNVFTPNGDGINDTYTLTNLRNPIQNLPSDNCDDFFQSFSVHDRNGASVFKSSNREFSWSGENVESGIYYYVVKFSRTEYKGYIHVLK